MTTDCREDSTVNGNMTLRNASYQISSRRVQFQVSAPGHVSGNGNHQGQVYYVNDAKGNYVGVTTSADDTYIWPIYDDSGRLPSLIPAPSGRQSVRTLEVSGSPRCDAESGIVFTMT
ncbi:hypothetical protein PWT90_10985 [Aphanocladium album]|nr:hypothetical protein PWT90_10985 [Aphanocladium album]